MIQTGKRSTALLTPLVLLLIVGCGGGKSASGPSATCKQGCYRGHGVSFNYPPKWQKGTDFGPTSKMWTVSVVRDLKYSDYVEIIGQGESELGFPPANLAAGKSQIKAQRETLGAFFKPGSEKLTIDGRPALRFRSTLSTSTGAARANTIASTWLLTFKAMTQYRFECTHQERIPHARAAAAEIKRGCAEIVRTFRVTD